jgi:hypothetical protein
MWQVTRTAHRPSGSGATWYSADAPPAFSPRAPSLVRSAGSRIVVSHSSQRSMNAAMGG